MFHTYVTASSGRKVDVDRAWYLMDKALLAEARELMERDIAASEYFNRKGYERSGLRYTEKPFGYEENRMGRARLLWSIYCRMHAAKYGKEFEPDHSLSWDT